MMIPCVLDYSREWSEYQAPSALLRHYRSLIATQVNCLRAQSCPVSSSPVVTLLYSSFEWTNESMHVIDQNSRSSKHLRFEYMEDCTLKQVTKLDPTTLLII